MANQPNSKLKLLYLLQIFQEKTDEEHGLSTQEIIEALAERGIDAARKSVYRDIEVLREAGFDIEMRREPYTVYALRSRPLDIEEMVLLVDAVQSCPFLTEEMTDTLIAKIGTIASAGHREMLARRIDVPGRVKMQNESVFENLDVIQHAMRLRRQVRFHYFKYDAKKRKELQHNGDYYTCAPIRLVYRKGYYYLITYNEKHQDWVNYRVDRMIDVEVTDEPTPRNQHYENYDPTTQQPWAFGVFNETPAKVTLAIDTAELPLKRPGRSTIGVSSIMSMVIDKLGPDVQTVASRDGKVRIYARIVPTHEFYGWLFRMSGLVQLEAPKRVVAEYRARLAQAMSEFEPISE